MKKRAYPLDPRKVSSDAWFYEEPRGILVVAELKEGAIRYAGTVQTRLSWKKLEKAVDNHRAIKRQRKRAKCARA